MGGEVEEQEKRHSSLRQTIEFLSSLISLSHSIKVFAAKWQSIRSKLEDLNGGLIAVENCDSDDNPVIRELVLNLMVTITECYDLARRCVDFSYSGKLLMQSDLDVISSKFDAHSKRLSEIYDAGILTVGFALVVSRPNFGACREDMRFYVRDLVTRMKIGDSEMKRQALMNLHLAVTEDEKYVNAIAELGDVVNVIANFLDSPETEIQEGSAKVMSVIAGFDSCKNVLIGAGAIAPLVRVLESGNEPGKEASARCLMKLTENSDNAWSVSAHGGVTALLKICSLPDCRAELIGPACGVLKNLTGVEEMRRFMAEEGAISTFTKLARSKDETVQINSIELLNNITFGDEVIREMVVKEGGIRALLRVIEPRSPCSSKTRETALRAIQNMCFASNSLVGILLNYSFVDHLIFFLRNGEVSVQELALKIAVRLSGTSEEAKKALGDAGFMQELVKFLDSKSFEVREMAVEALSGMVLVPRNRKRFAQDDRNIGLILQLLDPEKENSGNRKLLLSILMSLTSSHSGRRKISSSGHLKNVEKLAEAEVYDAKKLVRKLSTNRFRSMFRGIWHF
ncbi:Vacuolar protein 8 [Morus notabilis]|uniref:Vacuolar protein 8 n=1 Tax=Morus notabilis TaxID=981085 RepID=W9QLL2_9ROSA|nr:vacuolar protein 8 [Morus notabilis]EXB30586.1 Vacuolar protein 8 [Morus notabilis]